MASPRAFLPRVRLFPVRDKHAGRAQVFAAARRRPPSGLGPARAEHSPPACGSFAKSAATHRARAAPRVYEVAPLLRALCAGTAHRTAAA